MFKASALAALLGFTALAKAQSDPSVWDADPRLHRSLWGMAYTYVSLVFHSCYSAPRLTHNPSSESSSYYPQWYASALRLRASPQLMPE